MTGRLLLARHGETEWSALGRHTGRTDIPLTPDGVEQARRLAGQLAAYHPVRVLVSPLRRARETAELAGFDAAEVRPELAEWDYGRYEGMTREQILDRDPDWTIWTGPTPAGESAEEVLDRADRVLADVGPDLATGDVLMFSHGHFSRVLAVRWLALELPAAVALPVATASLCVLGEDRGDRIIEHWNIPTGAPS